MKPAGCDCQTWIECDVCCLVFCKHREATNQELDEMDVQLIEIGICGDCVLEAEDE